MTPSSASAPELSSFQGKVLLITGSTGIAAATAQLAIASGATLFITSRTAQHGKALQEQLGAPGRCAFFTADLRRPAAVQAAINACVRKFKRLDAVFNVAGISGRKFGDGPLHECTEKGWQMTFDHNLKTMFLVCRAALKQMLTQTPDRHGMRGAILNMSSVLGFSPSPKYFATHAYATSKAAILGLSQAMASHYAPNKIRVNVIAPALVRTPMSARAQQNDNLLDFIKSKQPLTGTMIEPTEVAKSALFLLGNSANNITGVVLTVDGGWCLSEGQFATEP